MILLTAAPKATIATGVNYYELFMDLHNGGEMVGTATTTMLIITIADIQARLQEHGEVLTRAPPMEELALEDALTEKQHSQGDSRALNLGMVTLAPPINSLQGATQPRAARPQQAARNFFVVFEG